MASTMQEKQAWVTDIGQVQWKTRTHKSFLFVPSFFYFIFYILNLWFFFLCTISILWNKMFIFENYYFYIISVFVSMSKFILFDFSAWITCTSTALTCCRRRVGWETARRLPCRLLLSNLIQGCSRTMLTSDFLGRWTHAK
jgi:hypothetical protein